MSNEPCSQDAEDPSSNPLAKNDPECFQDPNIDAAFYKESEQWYQPEFSRPSDQLLGTPLATGLRTKSGPRTVDPQIDPSLEKECEDVQGPELGSPADQSLSTLLATGPWPKPKPKNDQACIFHHGNMAHQSATEYGMHSTVANAESGNIHLAPPTLAPGDVHQSDSLGQIEETSGHPHQVPKKCKLDACLTIQFEAAKKERERAQGKLEKACAERLAKWDEQDSWPAKRWCIWGNIEYVSLWREAYCMFMSSE